MVHHLDDTLLKSADWKLCLAVKLGILVCYHQHVEFLAIENCYYYRNLDPWCALFYQLQMLLCYLHHKILGVLSPPTRSSLQGSAAADRDNDPLVWHEQRLHIAESAHFASQCLCNSLCLVLVFAPGTIIYNSLSLIRSYSIAAAVVHQTSCE